MAKVHIDIRKLLQFLAGQQVTPTKAVCSEFASPLLPSCVICIQSYMCKYTQFWELELPGTVRLERFLKPEVSRDAEEE